MDKDSKPPPTIKDWRCSAGHILGQVERCNRIHQLRLYRQAVQNGEEGKVIAQLSGPADITCGVCGRTREWLATEESLQQLLERVRSLRDTQGGRE